MVELAIVALVLGIANVVTNAIYKSIVGRQIKQAVAQLRKAITNDSTLKNKLIEIYNSKNSKAATSLFNSLPGGLSHQVQMMKQEIIENVNKATLNKLDQIITANSNKLEDAENYQISDFNSIENLGTAIQWNSVKEGLKPTRGQIDNDKTYKIKDQYGRDHEVSGKQLLNFTYGSDITGEKNKEPTTGPAHLNSAN